MNKTEFDLDTRLFIGVTLGLSVAFVKRKQWGCPMLKFKQNDTLVYILNRGNGQRE